MLAEKSRQSIFDSRYKRELYISLEVFFKNLGNEGKKIVFEGSEPLIYSLSEVISYLRNKNKDLLKKHTIIINRDSRFGACDVDLESYLTPSSDIDIVVHLGHNPFPNTFPLLRKLPLKIYFIPIIENIRVNKEYLKLIEKEVEKYMNYDINILYSIQYKNVAEEIAKYLSQRGFNVTMPKIPGLLRGQVLGCIFTHQHLYNQNEPIYLVVSSGMFHAMGIGIYTGKKVLKVDPFKQRIEDLSVVVKKYRALIAWNLFRAANYNKYAIVKIKDSHQSIIGGINYIIRLMDENKKEYMIYSVYRISEDFINNLPKDELPVIAGCPRIAIDDITRFNRPVINVEQLQILFRIRAFEDVYPL